LSLLQGNSCSIDKKSGGIWTVQTDLQQIYHKADRLLAAVRCIGHRGGETKASAVFARDCQVAACFLMKIAERGSACQWEAWQDIGKSRLNLIVAIICVRRLGCYGMLIVFLRTLRSDSPQLFQKEGFQWVSTAVS